MKTNFSYFSNLLIFSIADYVSIIYNMLDNTICNVDTQSEFTHIPSKFAMRNLEGNALNNFVLRFLTQLFSLK